MSKANILSKEKLENGAVRLTFDCTDGERTYEFRGNSAKAINRGSDPNQLAGKLVEHKKKEK